VSIRQVNSKGLLALDTGWWFASTSPLQTALAYMYRMIRSPALVLSPPTLSAVQAGQWWHHSISLLQTGWCVRFTRCRDDRRVCGGRPCLTNKSTTLEQSVPHSFAALPPAPTFSAPAHTTASPHFLQQRRLKNGVASAVLSVGPRAWAAASKGTAEAVLAVGRLRK